jgi:hypothetical protein
VRLWVMDRAVVVAILCCFPQTVGSSSLERLSGRSFIHSLVISTGALPSLEDTESFVGFLHTL